MATSSISSLSKTNLASLGHNYYFDPLLKLNRGAYIYNLPSNAALKLARFPPLISRTAFPSTHRSSIAYRPIVVNASAKKASDISVHQSFRILEIITFIWSLPGLFTRFFKKEEKFLDEVEEDIIKTADVIKGGAKVVEEVAEGLEEVAETIEKAAKTIDKDAKKVDDIMDEVKEKTKIAHDQLEEVVGSIQGSVEVVEKDVTKVQIKVKGTKEESTDIPNTTEIPSSKDERRDPIVQNPNTLESKPLQSLNLAWRAEPLLYGFLDALTWPFVHLCNHPLSFSMSRSTVLLAGTMLMVCCFGVMTTSPLIV